MKILCVIDSLGSGGAQRQLIELAKGFKERGHDVSFLVYHKENFFAEVLRDVGIQITCIIEPNYIKRLFEMRKFIRGGAFDAVISFLEASNFICECSGFPWRKWKLIVGERSANPKILKSFKLRMYRWFHFFADFIVANSYENLKLVKRINPLVSDSKCKVIYNLIDPAYFNNTQLIDDKKSLHVVVGASHQYLKNANGMIQAVAKLSSKQKARLKISWYGDNVTEPFFDNSFIEASKLVMESELGEIVKFYPATKSLMEIMNSADVVGLFSFYEGLPNSICEGMALGKPVMVSNVSDIPQLLKDTPYQIFDPNKSIQIRRAFEYYLELNPEELDNIGKHNKRVAQKMFDKEIIIQQYIDIMKS